MRAYCLIRPQPYYRREAFAAGLRAAGHAVELKPPDTLDKNTLLVIWNRYGPQHEQALRVEKAGGKVIVAENGYYGAGGTSPKFDVHPGGPKPTDYYALGLGWHNTESDQINVGSAQRLSVLDSVAPHAPNASGHVLVCPNRSFGVGERMMHPDWGQRVYRELSKITSRRIVIRPHPGNDAPKRTIDEDLIGAHVVVIWSSSCGVHALMRGIPVVCCAPHWICRRGAYTELRKTFEANATISEHPGRRASLEYMARSQWTCKEIESGEPFRYLLPN